MNQNNTAAEFKWKPCKWQWYTEEAMRNSLAALRHCKEVLQTHEMYICNTCLAFMGLPNGTEHPLVVEIRHQIDGRSAVRAYCIEHGFGHSRTWEARKSLVDYLIADLEGVLGAQRQSRR